MISLRILYITNRIPYPLKDGGAIAMFNMLEAFMEMGQEVHLLSLNTQKHFVRKENLSDIFSQAASFEAIPADTDVTAWSALLNLLGRQSYNISRFYSGEFEDHLIKTLKEKTFDIIHIEGLQMTLYLSTIRKYSKAPVSMRAHNVEYLIWQRLAEAEKPGPKKLYLNLLTKRLKKYETEVVKKLDSIVAISEEDAKVFRSIGCRNVYTSPTGLDLKKYPIDRSHTEWPSVFHLGSLDWQPNLQGLDWFLKEVWPKVHEAKPDLNFYIAGRNIPEWLKNKQQPGVKIVGEVQDAIAFMNTKAIMAVPLLSGSGIRIKILEGMVLGKTIISTAVGAEGIPAENGKEILIADSASGFVAKIIEYAASRSYSEELGNSARKMAEREFDRNEITRKLLGFYAEIAIKPKN